MKVLARSSGQRYPKASSSLSVASFVVTASVPNASHIIPSRSSPMAETMPASVINLCRSRRGAGGRRPDVAAVRDFGYV